MKRVFGILMLAVTLLSGITVFAQDNKNGRMSGKNMGGESHRRHRHHRRWHRRHRGAMKNDNMKH
jgi:hypothetical protein